VDSVPKPDIDPATFKRITGRSAPGPHEIAPGHLVLTGPSLHSGLNAPPPASQAFVLGGAHSYVDIHFIAMTYAGVGDKDQVFRWLEKGYEERSNQMVWLAVDRWTRCGTSCIPTRGTKTCYAASACRNTRGSRRNP
jgi:hypothetical protein